MKLSYNSPVILTFSIASLVVFILGAGIFGEVVSLKFTVADNMDFQNFWSYFRLFSHVLGHYDLQHLSGNILLLMLVGPLLEEKYGFWPLIIMMLLTALVTGLLHTFLFEGLLLGASGIVFMFITLSSFANRKVGELPLTMIFVVLAYLGQELLAVGNQNDNISHMAHIAGGVLGVIFGFLNKVD